jgi:hypothetical protein
MTRARRRPPRGGLVVLVVAVVTAASRIASSPASAGSYAMNQCQAAVSRAVSANWGTFGNVETTTWFNNCGASGGSLGLSGVWMPYDTVGGLNLAVPDSRPHVTIVGVEADVRAAAERLDSSNCCTDQYSFFRFSGGGQVVFDQEMTGWSQTISRDLPATRDFQAGIYCSYGTGPKNCGWTGDPTFSLGRLIITLQENDPPTAQVAGGTLITGGTRTGTQTLSYTATDEDSGIHDVAVQLGSTTVATDRYGERCTNDDWNACPTRQDRSEMTIDTSRVPDGTYPLKFVVTDAAGNTATVDSGRTVTIDNPGTNGPPAVGKATNVQLVLGQGQGRSVRTVYGRKVVLSGQALTPDSKPLAGVPIDVSAQIAQPGRDFSGLGQTKTDPNGGFAFTVPPGPSRTVRLAYTAPAVDGQQAKGQADVALQVRASAHLTVSDHKVAGGRRVTFRGQLNGGPFPGAGVPIGFRGKVGKHTRRFADTQADSKGRFRLTYKFPARGPERTYPVWVRVGADGEDYPYLPGLSNRVRVTVLR